jgi:hypothetical protein
MIPEYKGIQNSITLGDVISRSPVFTVIPAGRSSVNTGFPLSSLIELYREVGTPFKLVK